MTKEEAKVFLESVLPVLSAKMQLAIKTLVLEPTANLVNEEIKNMANRDIIIRIPEDKYDRIMQQMRLDRNFNACEIIELGEHGRIIDEEKINKVEKTGLIIKDGSVIRCFATDAPTIIKAHHPVSVKEQSQDRDDNLER